MSIESKVSGHWTDEQLIAHLYGIGPVNGHIDHCAECLARLSAMQAQRQAIEQSSLTTDDMSLEFLAAQRRQIYKRITEPVSWWSGVQLKRWASAAAGLLVLAGGLLLVENQRRPAPSNNISDAQLAQDVSRMAEDPESPATAPLQALFEE